MLISGMVGKEGNKRICVYFSDDEDYAEGSVPECKITSNKGFSPEEIKEMEEYLRENQGNIIEEAGKINPMKAFFTKN